MRLDTLEKRMLYYRNLTDYKLLPNAPVLLMLDGRAFSKFCKRFEKPYDEKFIDMMNQTAQYLCENIEGCKFAYVQSDEISLYVTDMENENSESWFSYRMVKMCSIAASLATAKFNQLLMIDYLNEKSIETLKEQKLVEFDCKVWNVPTLNDVFAWFLYRQIDCIRNSKQMAAQTFIPHDQLKCLHTDQQIAKLKDEKSIDWNDYSDDKKFGRFVYKESVVIPYIIPEKFKNGKLPDKMLETLITEDTDDGTFYYIERNKWIAHNGFELTTEEGKQQFYDILGWQR